MNNPRLAKVHPGIILLETFLEPLAISQDRLARDLCVQPDRIHEIVQGKRPISAEIALRLAHYFGISKRFWLDLQARYDRERERNRFGDRDNRRCNTLGNGPRSQQDSCVLSFEPLND